MDAYEPFVSFALVLGVGLLVGLQREQSSVRAGHAEGDYLGGIRTYPLYALCGGVSMLLAQKVHLWILPATFLAGSVPLFIAYADDVRRGKDRGLTSEAAFVLVFWLGALGLSSGVIEPPTLRLLVTASLGVTLTALLALKAPLHELAQKVSAEDLYGTIKFLVMAVIVLPLLPDTLMGPYEVINPRQIGWTVVLMSGLGLVGYATIRILGAGHGLALTGLLGGMVSSTAVTLAAAAQARKAPKLADSCALSAVLASCVMLVRVGLIVYAVQPALMKVLLIPLGAGLVGGLAGAVVLYLRSRKAANDPQDEVTFTNPCELSTALKFGALFVLILVLSKAASVHLGASGLYVAAFAGGLTDMDAITLSMSRLSGEAIAPHVACGAILLAGLSNSIVKGAIALSGSKALGLRVYAVFGVMSVTAAVAWWVG